MSKDQKEFAKASASKYSNPHKMVVLIDEEKIERMAEDEKYRQQYEGIFFSSAFFAAFFFSRRCWAVLFCDLNDLSIVAKNDVAPLSYTFMPQLFIFNPILASLFFNCVRPLAPFSILQLRKKKIRKQSKKHMPVVEQLGIQN